MGPQLLATPARWSVGAALLGGLAWVAVQTIPARFGEARERLPLALLVWLLLSVALWVYLRGEEARLARELRVARTGTSVQRRTVLRRRRPTPYFGLAMFWYAAVRVVGALASTTLGFAAVLLAEGDVTGAEAALAGLGGRLSALGRLGELRAVVQADVLRALGTEESLAAAIRALVACPPLPVVEAERYRVHVLVKALLQQGDEATARSLAEDLKSSGDHELRVYVTWLLTWFEWTHLGVPTEADVRLALLLARTHGAEDLVARLDARLGPPRHDEPCATGDGEKD
jgi:hypothetical protein